jgi:hypothetical protein
MFLCDECLKKLEIEPPFRIFRSQGPCEDCRKVRVCADYPTRLLPPQKPAEEKPQEATAP